MEHQHCRIVGCAACDDAESVCCTCPFSASETEPCKDPTNLTFNPLPESDWEDTFWEREKRFNLMLDNENYDDLMAFAREYEAAAIASHKEKCIEALWSLWPNDGTREEEFSIRVKGYKEALNNAIAAIKAL